MKSAAERLRAQPNAEKWLWFASSSEERGDGVERRFALLQSGKRTARDCYGASSRCPQEKHATIYHPAALKAFRAVLQP